MLIFKTIGPLSMFMSKGNTITTPGSVFVIKTILGLLILTDLLTSVVSSQKHISEAKRVGLVWHDFCGRTSLTEPDLVSHGRGLLKLCEVNTQWIRWRDSPITLFLISVVQHSSIGRLYRYLGGIDVFEGGILSTPTSPSHPSQFSYLIVRGLNLLLDEYLRWSFWMQCIALISFILWVYRKYLSSSQMQDRVQYYHTTNAKKTPI
jgi:hypothetical protein